MVENDPTQLFLKVIEILESLEIPYLISGGLAVVVWGRTRFTADIDIVVELQEKDIDNLERALKYLSQISYLDREMMNEALRTYGEFNFIDGNSGIKVDFW